MNFSDPETKKPLKEWEKYYLDLGVPIPQDKPGINPGIMSLSEKIQIVYHYGLPSKNKN